MKKTLKTSVKTGDRIKVVNRSLISNTEIKNGKLGTVIGHADDRDFVLVKFDDFANGHCGEKDFLEYNGFVFEEKDCSHWWVYLESIELLEEMKMTDRLITHEEVRKHFDNHTQQLEDYYGKFEDDDIDIIDKYIAQQEKFAKDVARFIELAFKEDKDHVELAEYYSLEEKLSKVGKKE